MTLQDIYDKVCIHLIIQGEMSVDDDGDCMYRGNNGTMCAVGCLIKDEFYSPLLENKLPTSDEVWDALEKSGIIYNHGCFMWLLQHLQDIHDKGDISDLLEDLANVAEDWKFTTDALEFAIEFKKGMTW